MRLCLVCGKPPNAGRHHPRPHEPIPASHVSGRHAFEPGEATREDARGHTMHLCSTCGGPRNSPRHRMALAVVDYRPGEYRRPAPAPEENAARETPRDPSPRAPSTGRRGKVAPPPTTPAEYVQAALAIDRILALPADLVGWRLRLRLADVRPLLGVPDYPVLGTPAPDHPGVEPDPEAPPPSLLEDRPALRPKVLEPAATTAALGIIRGIRSDRIKSLARRALDQGWDVSMTGGGHVRLAKGSQVIIASGSAETGSGHGWGNLRAQARRSGLDVTGL